MEKKVTKDNVIYARIRVVYRPLYDILQESILHTADIWCMPYPNGRIRQHAVLWCDAVICSDRSDKWYAISGMKNMSKRYFSYFVVIKGSEK
jgi:hypothetical protein